VATQDPAYSPQLPADAAALLLSGGLDSAILLGQLLAAGRTVQPLYIRSYLHWEPAELRAAQRFTEALAGPRLLPLVTLELPVADLYGDHWSVTGRGVPDGATPDEAVYLPGRNALLLIKALIWCRLRGIGSLALAPLGSNPFSDASPQFFNAFSAAVNQAVSAEIEILRPFSALHKHEVMRLGRGLPLELTMSCIDPQGSLHCGRCNKCAERQAAFSAADMPDATIYATRAPARIL
jgi:7-cyano-7-deazaguanine synthase